jgi:hypothetical protein
MNVTMLPKTEKAGELMWVRCLLETGFILLLVQLWARGFLSGPTRQHIEESLWPFPLFLGALLLYCAVVSFVGRERLLGMMAAAVGILSAMISLLPILLGEGIYD